MRRLLLVPWFFLCSACSSGGSGSTCGPTVTGGSYNFTDTLTGGTCGPNSLGDTVVIEFKSSPPITLTGPGQVLDPNPTINGCSIRFGYTVSNQGLCSQAESHVTYDLTAATATGNLSGTMTVSSCAEQDGGIEPCSGTYSVFARQP